MLNQNLTSTLILPDNNRSSKNEEHWNISPSEPSNFETRIGAYPNEKNVGFSRNH